MAKRNDSATAVMEVDEDDKPGKKTSKKAAAKEVLEKIVVKPPKRHQAIITLKGDTSIIFNPKTAQTIKEIEDAHAGKPKTKTIRKPRAEFQEKLDLRTISKGIYGFPCVGIKKSMITAAMRFQGGVMTVLRGLIFIEGTKENPDFVPLTSRKKVVMRTDSGCPPGQRALHIFYRPEVQEWKMVVPVIFNPDKITLESLVNMMAWAGTSIGLGSWRIENNGNYGAFHVESVKQRELPNYSWAIAS